MARWDASKVVQHRVTLLAATLLVGALAGCIGADPGPDVQETDPTAEDPAPNATAGVARPVVTDARGAILNATAFPGRPPTFDLVKVSDRISPEPTIGITRDGTVFYPAAAFDGPAGYPRTVYMRSTDGGESWEEANPEMAGVETHPTTWDPYVYTDPTTGRIYAMDMGPDVTCNKVSWSDDGGETWVTREGACIPGVNDHPTLFAGPAIPATVTPVYPNQLYLCTNQITDSLCYTSPDGGITWAATQPPYLGYDRGQIGVDPNDPFGAVFEGFCGGLHGHGQVSWAEDGTVYLGREWCGRPMVAYSEDGGLHWHPIPVAYDPKYTPSEHDISVGTDMEGNAYALWVGNEGRSVYLARSFDRGRSWEEPIEVTAPNVTGAKLPSLVAGSKGRVAFLYVGTENPHGHDVDAMEEGCDDPEDRSCYEHPDAYDNATWNAYVGTSLDAHTEDPVFATVTANPRDEPLKRGGCSGRCFGDSGGMYDFLDINVHPVTGRIWAALVDVCSGGCDDAPGAFDATERSVGVAARMAEGTTLLTEPMPER